MRLILSAAVAIAVLSGCSGKDVADPVTLYRSSPFNAAERVHFGTFDAKESDKAYNMNNCLMTSRLLNANVQAFAEREKKAVGFGFWCEPGEYRSEGSIPSNYQAGFPTDV